MIDKIRIILKRYRYYLLGVLFASTILIWVPVVGYSNSGLKVWFFDVGQGDAEFLDFFDGNQVLIDGGPDGSVLQKIGKAMPFYDRDIDFVILTHPHKDHIFGLIEVLKRYKVGKIILPKVDFASSFYDEFLGEVKKKNIPMEYLGAGDVVRIGDFAELDFLSPQSDDKEKMIFNDSAESFGVKGQQLNDKSLVFKLIFGNNSVLFTGDAGIDSERIIIAEPYNFKSDILKVGHHGSKYSSSDEFLKLVSPQYAVIEVGSNNRYGHPAIKTLDALTNISAKILRTDLNGDLIFGSDGLKWFLLGKNIDRL